jgi:hypothetical protein
MFLIGMKADLQDKREVTAKDVEGFMSRHSRVTKYYELSAKQFTPVYDEIFEGMIKIIRASKYSDFHRRKAQMSAKLAVLATRSFEIAIFKHQRFVFYFLIVVEDKSIY